jgi:hypothetical protein
VRELVDFDRFWGSISFALFALLTGALDLRWLAAASLVASVALAVDANDMGRPMRKLKNLAGFGDVAVRLIRLGAVLALGWHIWLSDDVATAFAVCGITMVLLSVAALVTTERLSERVEPSIFTRNLEVAKPPLPRAIKLTASGLGMAIIEVFFILGAVVTISNGFAAWVCGIIVVVLTACLVVGTEYLTNGPGTTFRNNALLSVQTAIADLHPQVALYVGAGRAESAYQVESWLGTIEQLDEPALAIVRSINIYEALGPTSVPIVALGDPQDLLTLDLSTLRATLFIANTGDTIHLLREQNPMSAFIGHGDSDKNSSFNPFTKVYDQVWVSGQAGADRYKRAEIGVHSEQFVHVGRPQLDAIDTEALSNLPANRIKTILYAPTWEGWNSAQEYTSLLSNGPAMIKELLAAPNIRLIYKPHPFTGIRSAQARAAHVKITNMLKAAKNTKSAPSQRMPKVRGGKGDDPMSALELAKRTQQFGADFFTQCDPEADIVINRDSDVSLFSCFEYSDALITDVSSVVSDFVALDRPYAVCDTDGIGEAGFVDEYPSAGGGIVIGPDNVGVSELVAVVSGSAEDRKTNDRSELRTYLIGEGDLRGTELFRHSITELIRQANVRIEHRTARAEHARQLGGSNAT